MIFAAFARPKASIQTTNNSLGIFSALLNPNCIFWIIYLILICYKYMMDNPNPIFKMYWQSNPPNWISIRNEQSSNPEIPCSYFWLWIKTSNLRLICICNFRFSSSYKALCFQSNRGGTGIPLDVETNGMHEILIIPQRVSINDVTYIGGQGFCDEGDKNVKISFVTFKTYLKTLRVLQIHQAIMKNKK